MAGLTPLPQTVLHQTHPDTRRLTHSQAYELLSSFLTAAETTPSYRPDAVLTPHGPQAAGIGADSQLTLNHLNRIRKGIAGKRIGGVEFNFGDGPRAKRRRDELATRTQGGEGVKKKKRQYGEEVVELQDAEGGEEAAVVARETDDWQDKDDYELAQVEEMDDLGTRNPAEADPTHDAIEGRADDLQVTSVMGQKKSKAEKEARKLAKLARRKNEKREKHSTKSKTAR